MTSVDQAGYLTIGLTITGDLEKTVRLGNIKPTATDADIYAVGVAIQAVLDGVAGPLTRNEKTGLTA